jgi:LCP family protein required for cell wall assembly
MIAAMSSQPDPEQTARISLPGEEPQPPAPTKKRRALRFVLIALLAGALLGGGGAIAGGFYLRSVEKGIVRVDAFAEVPTEGRPEKVVQKARNILLLGSDSRDPDNTGGSRSDTIIVAHLPADRSSAQLISIPRDTWVHVPASKNGKNGNRDAKINASYAWGGIPLVVQTVEKFTGVRIDNVAIIDFAGFQEIVDALGGIDLYIEQDITSIHEPFRKFSQGEQHLDGAAALDYARQRKQFADGDFARIRHQQQVIKAILDKAATGGTLANPAKLNSFLRATADAVSVDKTMSIFDTATEMRDLRSGNLTFLTNPSKGTGKVGGESVVFPDKAKAKALYDAVREDAVDDILRASDE